MRATARVFEVDANTVVHWLVEAAEQRRAFSASFLCALHVKQRQLDALYAVLRNLKAGAISDDEATQRLERSPSWVWTAMAPDSKLLLVIDVGTRTLEMAQRVVHQVAQRVAPTCMPLWLSDGFKGYLPAILGHCGVWVQPERRQATGPVPKPRWMPRPGLLYAQVIKQYRRNGLVGVKHRVGFGTLGPSSRCWPHMVGRSIHRLSKGSTSTSASGWQPWGVGSTRSVRARTAYASSWGYIKRTIISACPTPACVSRCQFLRPPMGAARPRCGDRVRRRWQRD